MLKVYEEKMMAKRKADQERSVAEGKAYEETMMADRKRDQKKGGGGRLNGKPTNRTYRK
jgi:hypothetical protein